MVSTVERIEAAKKKVEEAKTLKIQLEERIVNTQKSIDDLVKQMQEYGTSPATIEQDITDLDKQILANLETIETVLKDNAL